MPNLPCHGSAYTITDKNFTISFDEDKGSVDSSGNRKFDCIQKKVFQKDLAKTDQLMQLSSTDLDD